MAAGRQGLNFNSSGFSDLKNRLLFVLLAIFIFRLGSYIPVPGLNPARLQELFNSQQNNIVGLFNMFSGGALMRFSVFALCIMPYISASIIIQLLTVLSPSLSELRKEGEAGQRKINKYTRYGTVLLSAFQAIGVSKMLAANHVALDANFSFYFTTTLTLITGTMFLMWLGEQMTERGIGNGISMIIFAGIVAGLAGLAVMGAVLVPVDGIAEPLHLGLGDGPLRDAGLAARGHERRGHGWDSSLWAAGQAPV